MGFKLVNERRTNKKKNNIILYTTFSILMEVALIKQKITKWFTWKEMRRASIGCQVKQIHIQSYVYNCSSNTKI